MWSTVGLGHSHAFPICAVLGAEEVSSPEQNITRFLKYTAYCHLCHCTLLQSHKFLQSHELLTATNYISQTMQHKQKHYSFIYVQPDTKKSHCFTTLHMLDFLAHLSRQPSALRLSCLCGLG